ncbi:ATP-dependent helicase [uncultured Xylophilus sp.]|uniref:ATP-dependent helicase n=1 Tax=uncultured Xylophilus sp. TaxID=296832 RepID=UPI0025FDFF58|nr:ATP-dependent helicase [uncultured Xylophilus sp.]
MPAAGTAVVRELRAKRLGIDHLIVDEYQDCTPAQHRLIAALARKARTTMVVGDPMQAIYGFGGSRYRSLRKVLRKAGVEGEVQVRRLDRSRRLTPQIAVLASAISRPLGAETIKSAKHEVDGRVPKLLMAPDMNTLGRDIAGRIQRLLSKGIKPRQIALLGRVKALLHPVAQHLRALGIPTILADTDKHLGDVLNVLWLADRVEQMHDLGAGLFGVGAKKRNRRRIQLSPDFERDLRDELSTGQDVYLSLTGDDAVTETVDVNNCDESKVNARWTKFVAELAKMRRGSDLEGRYRMCALAFLRLHGGVRANKGMRDQLNAWTPRCRDFADAAAMAQQLRAVQGRKAIHCSSIHGAKGMEWDYVFVLGMTEGVLPDRRAKTKEQRDEERRILYVAVTRAARRLWLAHAPVKVAKVQREYRQLSALVAGLSPIVLKKTKVR